jgi:Xaa-Pro aminopeptidase
MKNGEFAREELRKSMGFSPSVPATELDGRIKRCREQLRESGAAALLIFGSPWEPDAVRYLVNFIHPIKISESLLFLPVEGEPVLLLDRMWWVDHAKEMSFVEDVRAFHGFIGLADQFSELVGALGAIFRDAGVETGKVYISERAMPTKYFRALEQALPKVLLEDATGFLNRYFQNITEYDRSMIMRTAHIADESMRAALDACKEGVKEYEVGLSARSVMLERGAEFGSVNTIPHCYVASAYTGPTSTRPYDFTTRRLQNGDLFYIDLSICYRGYYTDMCRTVVIGEPSQKQRKIFDAALDMHRAMFESLKPGVTGTEVWEAGHAVAERAEYTDYTEKRTYYGHGAGIQISLPPFFCKGETRKIKDGCFYNIEPGVFMPGQQASLEDMILVRNTGNEFVTECERDLHIA